MNQYNKSINFSILRDLLSDFEGPTPHGRLQKEGVGPFKLTYRVIIRTIRPNYAPYETRRKFRLHRTGPVA